MLRSNDILSDIVHGKWNVDWEKRYSAFYLVTVKNNYSLMGINPLKSQTAQGQRH